jgi:multidrug transporter EmrE-like cation transporter
MTELTANVNWLAVFVGFVLSFLLGWLWYNPKLFGTKWAEGVGVKIDTAGAPQVAPMVLQAIGTFLLAWLVGITAGNNALATIILIAITIIVLMAAGGKFSRKSNYAMWTEVGFVAAMVVIMIAVQGIL